VAKRSDAGPIALDVLESAGALVLACKTCTVSKDLIPTPLRITGFLQMERKITNILSSCKCFWRCIALMSVKYINSIGNLQQPVLA
jgi:hypothetical protein